MGIIYRYSNPFNSHGYTGKTERSLEKRDRERFWKSASHDSKALKNAIAKYGKEYFTLEVIQDGIMHPEVLNIRERYWIRYFDDFHNGYNRTEGGDGVRVFGKNNHMFGKSHSDETKQKISETRKRNKLAAGENNPMFGRKHSDETCQKISETQKHNGSNAGENNPMFGRKGENHPKFGKKQPKHSERMTGENNPRYGIGAGSGKNHPMYGRTGEDNPRTRPEYTQARVFFFLEIAPMDIDIYEKRKQCNRQAFHHIPRTTCNRWINKWQRELENNN